MTASKERGSLNCLSEEGAFLEYLGGRKQTARDCLKEGRCGENAQREGLDPKDPGVPPGLAT